MSSFTNFLFGYVAEDGTIENDDWDDDMKKSLQQLPASLLGNMLKDLDTANSTSGPTVISPLKNAVDYADITELADEDKSESLMSVSTFRMESMSQKSPSPKKETVIESIYALFPTFRKHKILNFSELFHAEPVRKVKRVKRQGCLGTPLDQVVYDTDEELLVKNKLLLKRKMDRRKRESIRISLLPTPPEKVTKKNENSELSNFYEGIVQDITKHVPDHSVPEPILVDQPPISVDFDVIKASCVLNDWEERISWDDDGTPLQDPHLLKGLYANPMDLGKEDNYFRANYLLMGNWINTGHSNGELILRVVTRMKNYDLEYGDWDERIIWDDENLPSKLPIMHLVLDKNDPFNVFDDTTSMADALRTAKAIYYTREIANVEERSRIIREMTNTSRPPDPYNVQQHNSLMEQVYAQNKSIDPYYLSFDRIYDPKQNQIGKVRHTFGQLVVAHSLPAWKLSPAIFKTYFTKQDLRHFHRPQISIDRSNVITFTAVKEAPEREIEHIPTNVKELSLRDDCHFVLLEYSEQHPPLIMNVSMGTLINNYYRKKDEADDFSPDFPEGLPVSLEPNEVSPFFAFGPINPGETISALYNNMFRAPIFEHEPRKTDFLLIRHTSKTETKYYLRKIPTVFVVGQTFPLLEVPAYSARRLNYYYKSRVLFTAWRLMKKEKAEKQLKISQLLGIFKELSDTNIRKYLKEIAEPVKGKDGVWALKPNVQILSEEKLRKLITPENACQHESSLAAQQRLKDQGYVEIVADFDDRKDEEDAVEAERKLDLEYKLAPWITTTNFIEAVQGKAMLELYGPGDPTGRDEGFSFLRTSMKSMFYRKSDDSDRDQAATNSKYTLALQQQAYKEEISRIWNAQKNSLSSDKDLEEEELEAADERTESADVSRVETPDIQHKMLGRLTEEDAMSTTSFESRNSSRQEFRSKTLTIKRRIQLPNGTLTEQVEVIRDTKIINAYLRQKQLKEMARQSEIDGTSPTEKSLGAHNPFGATDDKKSKKQSTQRCSNCGQVGHTKTSRKCPNYRENIMIENVLEEERAEVKQEGTRISIAKSAIKIPKLKREKSLKLDKRKRRLSMVDDTFPKYRRRRPLSELAVVLEGIWTELKNLPNSWPFHEPVNPKEVPNYYDVIKKPRDLSGIRKDLKNLKYRTARSFLDDIQLMSDNCVLFNSEMHNLSYISKFILKRAEELCGIHAAKIKELESEIEQQERKESSSSVTELKNTVKVKLKLKPFIIDAERSVAGSVVEGSVVDDTRSVMDESILDESMIEDSMVEDSMVEESMIEESLVEESLVVGESAVVSLEEEGTVGIENTVTESLAGDEMEMDDASMEAIEDYQKQTGHGMPDMSL